MKHFVSHPNTSTSTEAVKWPGPSAVSKALGLKVVQKDSSDWANVELPPN